MLSTLITSAVRRKLLVLFLTHPEERFYASQLIRDLGVSSSQTQKELARLEQGRIIVSRREGNARFFSVNRQHPLYPELKAIAYKTEGLGDALRESIQNIEEVGVALIYGSVARDFEDTESDVDVLIIGRPDPDDVDNAVSRIEVTLKREVNVTTFTSEEWRERVQRGQSFARDIISGPKIFIVGDDAGLL